MENREGVIDWFGKGIAFFLWSNNILFFYYIFIIQSNFHCSHTSFYFYNSNCASLLKNFHRILLRLETSRNPWLPLFLFISATYSGCSGLKALETQRRTISNTQVFKIRVGIFDTYVYVMPNLCNCLFLEIDNIFPNS